MSWLKLIKNKSSRLIKEYKLGLQDFVTNLNNDIDDMMNHKSNKHKICIEDQRYYNKVDVSDDDYNDDEFKKNYGLVKEILEAFELDKKATSMKDLKEIVQRVEKQDYYLKKDPFNLVLLDRDDFTNFTVFYDKYHSNSTIIEKLLRYDPLLPTLLVNDQSNPAKHDTINRFLLRFLYLIVYYIETKACPVTNTELVNEPRASENNPSEIDDGSRLMASMEGSLWSMKNEVISLQGIGSLEEKGRIEEEIRKGENEESVLNPTTHTYTSSSHRSHLDSDDWGIEATMLKIS